MSNLRKSIYKLAKTAFGWGKNMKIFKKKVKFFIFRLIR